MTARLHVPQLVDSPAPPHASIVVQESLPPEAMLERCVALHTADKTAEARKKRFTTLGAIAGGATVLSFFAAGITETPALFGLVAVFLALAIGLFIARGVFGAADIDDRRLHVVRTLVEVLKEDMKRQAPVQLWLDFGGYHRTRAEGRGTGMFRSTGQLTYQRPWLRMTFTLADGSQVAVHASTTCKRKERSKRKYTKIKDRIVDELSVFVRPPRGQSFDPSAQARARAAMPTRLPLRCTAVRVKPRQAELAFRSHPGTRLRGRGGWTANVGGLLDGKKALEAVMASYRASAATRVRAAAGAE
ncbi:MAG: hypothetical protein KC933_23625 [Myxococcales bacterium]|nr:hypothetical protein [Myxococcales bacterium]MCB9646380.1 hypothetical protein [Deltaproteobacteria bacterium]